MPLLVVGAVAALHKAITAHHQRWRSLGCYKRLFQRRNDAFRAIIEIAGKIDRSAHPISRVALIIQTHFVKREVLSMIYDTVSPGHDVLLA